MTVFQHVMGGKLFTIAAGFDMVERKPDTHLISWCDPDTMSWEMTPENQAGHFKSPVALSDGVSLLENSFRLSADGYDIVVSHVGYPIVFGFNFVPVSRIAA